MASLNKVFIIGHLGNDPEIKTMQSGDRVANFSVAATESWKDKATGERKERTEWLRVVVFNQGLIKVCENYLSKGSKVYIEGRIETRSWEKDGQKQYATEVVLRPYQGDIILLDKKGEEPTKQSMAAVHGGVDTFEDEIPF
jgi:single-strand DNA-binding protein